MRIALAPSMIAIMKRICFAALIGWILIVPPAIDRDGIRYIDPTAPAPQWQRGTTFGARKDCEDAVVKLHAAADQNRAAEAEQPDFGLRRADAMLSGARCIVDDDPHLK